MAGMWRRYGAGLLGRFVASFEKWLNEKAPHTYKYYNLSKTGTSSLFHDVNTLRKTIMAESLDGFTAKELEVYRMLPGEMLRVSPTLVILMLPMMQYVILPIAFAYPRHLLSHHFWTEEQRLEFGRERLLQRQRHFPSIARYLVRHLHQVPDADARSSLDAVLDRIHGGVEARVADVIGSRAAFTLPPFSLQHLTRHRLHLRHLAASLNCPSHRPSRIKQDVELFARIDRLLLDGPSLESTTALRLFELAAWRGLDAQSLPRGETVRHLRRWAAVSAAVDARSKSLLLHTPALLYSHLHPPAAAAGDAADRTV